MGRSGIAGAQRRRRSLQRLFEQLQSQFWRRWFWRRRLRRWRSLQRRRFWWWRFSRRGWRGLGRSLWRRRLWGRRLPWWWWVRGTALIPCSTAIMGRVARPRASYCWQRGLADESGVRPSPALHPRRALQHGGLRSGPRNAPRRRCAVRRTRRQAPFAKCFAAEVLLLMDGVEAACSLASWAQRLSELALGL